MYSNMEGLPNKTVHSCHTVCFVNNSCVCKEENMNTPFMYEEILKRIDWQCLTFWINWCHMLTGDLMYSEKLFILKCPHVHTNSKTIKHLKPMYTRTQYVRFSPLGHYISHSWVLSSGGCSGGLLKMRSVLHHQW